MGLTPNEKMKKLNSFSLLLLVDRNQDDDELRNETILAIFLLNYINALKRVLKGAKTLAKQIYNEYFPIK